MVVIAKEDSFSAWIFLIGFILAILIGLAATILPIPTVTSYNKQIYAILVILGLIVGFLGISQRSSQTFLLAGAVLVIVSRFGMESVKGSLIGVGIGDAVSSVFAALLSLFVPATIVAALKTLFYSSRV